MTLNGHCPMPDAADTAPRLVRWTLPVTGEDGWNRADLALAMVAVANYDRALWARLNRAWQEWRDDDTHVLLTSPQMATLRDALVMATNAWAGNDQQHAAELLGSLL